MLIAVFVIVFAYVSIGMFVGKAYYQRRHGVYKKIINGGADAIFSIVTPISLVWPILFLFPGFRQPTLCRHPSHVLQRDAARAEYEQYQAAAARDDGYRR